MKREERRERGYSLSELLTVVAIVGMVAMVSLPAFMQLMPQYRIRSASSEIAASLRMVRGKAVSTRSNWKMTVDPVNEKYRLQRLIAGTWTPMGENAKPLPAGMDGYKTLSGCDIQGASNFDVIFTRDGSKASSGSAASMVLAVDNNWVKFNRYTIAIDDSGNIGVTASKV